MKTISAKWFECKVAMDRVMENGLTKKVTEVYVVDALSFTEAEARIIEEVAPFTAGEFQIKGITPAAYKEVSFMQDGEAILANETQKLMRAMQVGKGEEQFKEKTDFNPANVDAHWYKAKVAFITLDEKTGAEKRSNVTMLVQACSLHNATENIDTIMQGSMIDFVSVNAAETAIVDVFQHVAEKEEGELAPIEVVEVSRANSKVAIGRRLVHPICNHWEETFKDEDTGEEVKIDRQDVLYSRGERVTPEMWEEIVQRGYKDITLYRC